MNLSREISRRLWYTVTKIAPGFILVTWVAILFAPTATFDFVNFDDDHYVYENPYIADGLTWSAVYWAFTSFHSANYHPITWLSHMADISMWGYWAGGHHLCNVVWHALGAVFLFLFLRRLTEHTGLSFCIALLFAIHPLRVESVAWVAERKDVLSGALGFASLWAYMRYAAGGRFVWLMLSFLLFGIGLLAKPTLVMLPFALLLVDFAVATRQAAPPSFLGFWARRIVEKAPFAALSLAAAYATIHAQENALVPIDTLPFSARVQNAVWATVAYLGKIVMPICLYVPYPLRVPDQPVWHTVVYALGWIISVASALYVRRKNPWFLMGILWYWLFLIPVLGIVQVGNQSMADRYTYLPSVGVFLAAVCAVGIAAEKRRNVRIVLPPLFLAVAIIFSVLTWRQLQYWKDSESLFTHALACDEENSVAHNNLGKAVEQEGRLEEAQHHFERAVQIAPTNGEAWFNLGTVYLRRGKYSLAAQIFENLHRMRPDDGETLFLLAQSYLRMNAMDKAFRYAKMLSRLPEYRRQAYWLLEQIAGWHGYKRKTTSAKTAQ